MRRNLLDSKHWLAILARSERTVEDSGGIMLTYDLGWVWWVQDGSNRDWIAIAPHMLPRFPDPIAIGR